MTHFLSNHCMVLCVWHLIWWPVCGWCRNLHVKCAIPVAFCSFRDDTRQTEKFSCKTSGKIHWFEWTLWLKESIEGWPCNRQCSISSSCCKSSCTSQHNCCTLHFVRTQKQLCGFGSRPSDHYFRSVCLFVCAEFFQPSSIRFGSN